MRLLVLAVLGLTLTTHAGAYRPTPAQLLSGAQALMTQFLAFTSKNNGPQLATLYYALDKIAIVGLR